MKYLFAFSLILLLGIIPVMSFSFAAESNQICIDKVWIENSKGKIACVTSDAAEKLVQRGWGTLLSDDAVEKKSADFELPPYPEQDAVNVQNLENAKSLKPEVVKVTDGFYQAQFFLDYAF